MGNQESLPGEGKTQAYPEEWTAHLSQEALAAAQEAVRAVAKSFLNRADAFLAVQAPIPELEPSAWKFDCYADFAGVCSQQDADLNTLVYIMVPKRLEETEFWRVYFCHVYLAVSGSSGSNDSPQIAVDAEKTAVEEKKKPTAPLVICGPSGVGKGTMIQELFKRHPNSFGFSVSHTTRAPREGEVHGQHYNFMSLEEMKKEVEEGKFIEACEVHGNMYGTSKAAVQTVADEGKICVLDIDVQGVQKVKAANLDPKPVYVFIMPPGDPLATLEARIRQRGSESEETIRKRLDNAVSEMAYAQEERYDGGSNFDSIIVNDTLQEAVDELDAITQKMCVSMA